MCIAIYSLKGTDIPSEDILKTCFLNNPDGAGFAFNKGGKVHIVKGFMDYKGFISAFKKYDAEFGFKQRGVLIHFRIATHGGVNVGCCHPFPISPLSDTMLFIRDYLTKIGSNRNWFYNKKNTELIYELINSKMAILNGNGDITATEGFHQGADGNYYSNCSYMNTCLSLYDEWFYDDAFSEMPLMQLKRNEIVCFNDGRTEEYESGFHDLYPIYLTKEGDVYADYIGCSAGEKIPMEQLELLGEGSVFKSNSPVEQTAFRKDAIGLI